MRRQRRLKADINVVPYIDVMLVLLVIFMVTAPMIQPFEIELPQVGRGGVTSSSSIEVQIKASPDDCECGKANELLQWRYPMEGSNLTRGNEKALLAAIRAKKDAHPDLSVGIAADRTVCYESVLRVWDLLKRENVARVGLLAQPLPATPAAGARP